MLRPLEAERAPLRGLSADERERLAPLLDRGVVGLVEFAREAELPAVLVAMRVPVAPDTLAEVLATPARWPRFLPAVDSVEVERRDPRGTTFRWTWRLGPFTFRGRNALRHHRLRDGTEGFSIRALEGDLGRGRMRWWVHPLRGRRGALLVLASRVDLRDANYVTRQLTAGGNGINRSVNVAMAFVMALAVAEEGCRRAGRSVAACWPLETGDEASGGEEVGPPLRLEPLLSRGDLVLVRIGEGRKLDSVSVLARMGRRPAVVRAVLQDPEAFGSALVRGSRAEVISRGPEGVRFAWSVPLPLVGASGELLVAERSGGDRFEVTATRGALSGGHWRFDLDALPWHEAVLQGAGRFDPGDVSWLLRALCDGIRWFEHGLAAASQVMVVRSVRMRARYRWR